METGDRICAIFVIAVLLAFIAVCLKGRDDAERRVKALEEEVQRLDRYDLELFRIMSRIVDIQGKEAAFRREVSP